MLRTPRFWFTLVSIWFVVLFILSNTSNLTTPGPDFENKDKVLHFGYYALGGAWFFAGLRLFKPSLTAMATALLTILLCSAIGVFDEWHQSFIPNRSGNDFGDWCADTLGGIGGAILGEFTVKMLKSPSCPQA